MNSDDASTRTPPAIPPRVAVTGVAATLVFLVSLNLRPAITGVGPILPMIGESEGLAEGPLGILGAIPLLAFAAISPLVHWPSRKFGIDRMVLVALLVLAAGIALRSYGGQAGLWTGTIVLSSAIAIANVLVPSIVRRDYSTRISGATGLYSAFMSGGSAVAAAIAVPIANAAGWKSSLALWAIPAIVVAVLWVPRAINQPQAEPARAQAASSMKSDSPSVWKRPQAWLLTAFMGLQSMSFYTVITWWATIEIDGGVAPEQAGIHMTLLQVFGIVASLAIPPLMKGARTQSVPAIAASTPMLIAVAGMLAAPSLGTLWVIIAGIGQGAALVVALAMISLAGHDAHDTTRLSGMAQSVGYLLASVGPIAAGYLGQHSGSWTPTLLLLAAMGVAQLAVGAIAGRTVQNA